jgi:SnoaL-like domain
MSGVPMTSLERLTATEEIKQLKARYFRALDTKDWDVLRQQFADDIVADMRNTGGELVVGAEAFILLIRGAVETLVTMHHGHTPEIEITSFKTARGVWAMEDKLWKPAESLSTSPFTHLHGYGHYHETYEKVGARWLIKSTRLTRLRVDIT